MLRQTRSFANLLRGYGSCAEARAVVGGTIWFFCRAVGARGCLPVAAARPGGHHRQYCSADRTSPAIHKP